MKYLFIAALTFLCVQISFGQRPAKPGKGEVEVVRDERVDLMVKRDTVLNKERGTVEGFRLQLFSSINRAEVYDLKGKFYTAFPDIPIYISYQQPYFKLRVGNYRTRLEAYHELQKVSREFPDAFITPDELKISEL